MADMDFLETVNRKILENRTEMLASLSKLISIRSVAAAAEGGKPFGEEVDKAYRLMLEMGEKEG